MSPLGFAHARQSEQPWKAVSERQPTIHTQQTYWSYEDIGLFFFSALFLGVLLHSAVRLHLLSAASVNRPTLALQTVVLLSLLSSLYSILKLRYRRHVWRALGWRRPSLRHSVLAVFGGAALAIPVALFVRWSAWMMPSIRLWDLVLLGAFLGPALEESFFRGCLLPVLARIAGVPIAVLLSALLFTVLHKPATLAQWVFVILTGAAYGWMHVSSRSTAAATLMHSAYNVTLFVCQAAGLC